MAVTGLTMAAAVVKVPLPGTKCRKGGLTMSKGAQEETSGPARPFDCGWFIREFLLGLGPKGSLEIDPETGATQADINYAYMTCPPKRSPVIILENRTYGNS